VSTPLTQASFLVLREIKMKIGGIDPKTMPTEVILVLPRGESEIVFRARGVPDYEEFNKLCPEPTAPKVHTAKDGWQDNVKDPGYRDMMKTYGLKRFAWLVINSLEPSDLEWETVIPDNPSTWLGWEDEMRDSGFSQVECNRVQTLVMEANCLDEEKLDRARENFLRGQQPVPEEYSGQSIEPETTQSGEPASE
jgi:hypothetical protein